MLLLAWAFACRVNREVSASGFSEVIGKYLQGKPREGGIGSTSSKRRRVSEESVRCQMRNAETRPSLLSLFARRASAVLKLLSELDYPGYEVAMAKVEAFLRVLYSELTLGS